ncbi:MAG: archaeosortase/exosortase family protein [Planctomycetota bacterium]
MSESKFCKKIWGVLLFLCLMLPWPNRIQAALALPLQKWATISAVFSLETIGYEVMREGNYIHGLPSQRYLVSRRSDMKS